MERRVHEVLDGVRDPSELTREERIRLALYRRAVARGLARIEEEAAPDLSGDVMARIEGLEASPVRDRAAPIAHHRARSGALRWLRWLWEPREIRLRPAWAFAAGLLVVALVARGRPGAGGDLPPATLASSERTSPAAVGTVLVQFRLEAPGARAVHLAGDFTDWAPAHALHEQAPGVWSLIVPLAPGVHDYAFVVDGTAWTADPLAPQVADGFGGTNSRLAVLLPGAGDRS